MTRMRRLALALACAAALCAPSSTTAGQAAGVAAETRCAGTVTVTVVGKRVRASSIKTTKVSCTVGRALIGSFLTKVDSSRACRRAAGKAPPTKGCMVVSYHCFRNKPSASYCATVSGKLVQWRERKLLSGSPPRSAR
jgi:hypothetical protein